MRLLVARVGLTDNLRLCRPCHRPPLRPSPLGRHLLDFSRHLGCRPLKDRFYFLSSSSIEYTVYANGGLGKCGWGLL